MATVTLKVKGQPGTISFDTFLGVMNNSFDVLKDLDSAISLEPRGSLDWVVTKMSFNSLALEISSKARNPERDYGTKVVDNYIKGIKIIQTEERTPPYFSDNSLKRLRKIASMLSRNGADALEVTDPYRNNVVEFNRKIQDATSKLIGDRYKAHGSIEGTLEMISIHKTPRFNIYHNITMRAIRCTLPEDQRKDIGSLLGRRVIASGLVSYNAKDEPISVMLNTLEVLPKESELPTIEQFIGSDPDYTGDMTTEEYLRSIRND